MTGPTSLPVGNHTIELRVAIDSLVDLPIGLTIDDLTGPLDLSDLSHDETNLLPVMNTMPDLGTDLGGNQIIIDGLGFFPASSVVVHWGGTDFDENDFTVLENDRIEFLSPPGSGAINVTVETPNGVSNQKTFTYSPTGPVPINFVFEDAHNFTSPTAGVWGPDGRFYVSSRFGQIRAFEFDDDYGFLSQSTHTGVSGLDNDEVLGLAINPYDPPDPVRLYVAHGDLFVNGGGPPGTLPTRVRSASSKVRASTLRSP